MEYEERNPATLMFYETIKSNNLENLKKLLDSTQFDSKALFFHLARAFEEVKLKNIPIERDAEFEITSKLVNLQFFTENKQPEIVSINSFVEIKTHLNSLCDLLKTFLSKYYDSCSTVDGKFIFLAKHIAQYMATIKRFLEFSYVVLPWEEMEFILVLYLHSILKSKKTDIIDTLVLDRKQVLNFLQYFSNELEKINNNLTEDNLTTKLKALRNEQKQEILAKSPFFNGLYNDFSLLRNVYSLRKIEFYIKQAISVDLKKDTIVGQLVIERTMHVMGEYIKNTPDSPNLSDDLYLNLLRTAPRNLRNVMIGLRDMLSHASSLSRKLELTSDKGIDFFIKIQNDLGKIYPEIVYILFKKKIDAVRVFLNKILNCQNINEIKLFVSTLSESQIENNLDKFDFNYFSKIRSKIKLFIEQIAPSVDENELFRKNVFDILDLYQARLKNIIKVFNRGFQSICKFRSLSNIEVIHNLCRTYLYEITANNPQNLYKQLFSILKQIYETYKRNIIKSAATTQSTEKLDELDSVGNTITDIYHLVKNEIRDIQWIEEIKDWLIVIKNIQQNKKKVDQILDEIHNRLELELEKSTFSEIITKKKEIYANKLKALECTNRTTLQAILKSFFLTKTLEKEIMRNFGTPKGISKIKDIPDGYGTLVNKLDDLFPSPKYKHMFKNFFEKLELKELQNKIERQFDNIINEEVKLYYTKRLNTLERVLGKILQKNQIENNDHLKSALEILVLDLVEYLEKIKLLGDNKLFLIEPFPVLIGKQLRNYLAHGNLLYDILLFNPFISVICYAYGLVNLKNNLLDNKGTVGFTMDRQYFDFKQYFKTCLEIFERQATLSEAVQSKNITFVKNILAAGGDCNGQGINGWNALDYSIMSGDMQKVKFVVEFGNFASSNRYHFHLKTCIEIGNVNILGYLINLNPNILKYYGDNLITWAVKAGQTDILNFLISKGVKTECIYLHDTSLLHEAVKSGHLDIVEVILKAKPTDINARSLPLNITPLHIAGQYGHLEIVRILLKNGADITAKTKEALSVFDLAAIYGHTEVLNFLFKQVSISLEDYLNIFHFSIQYGRNDTISMVLKVIDDIDMVDKDGWNLLHKAAYSGHRDIVLLLLEKGANIHLLNKNIRSSLHLASQCGHYDTAIILLEHDIDKNAVDITKWTALHWAVNNNHKNLVELLIEKNAIIDARDSFGKTVLHIASENGYTEIVKVLLDRIENINVRCNKGNSILHYAVQNGHNDIVNILMDTCTVNINVKNNDDETPLMLAVSNGYLSTVDMLLEKGATVNTKSKKYGYTALTKACQLGYTDVVSHLIDEFEADIEIVENDQKWRALHWAAQDGYADIVEILIKKKVDVKSLYEENGTALHSAVRGGHFKVADMLINAGADVNAMTTKQQLFPLRIAAEMGHKDVILLLLLSGAAVNALGDNVSALHIAAKKGHKEIVDILIQHDAIVDIKGQENWTPLHLATRSGFMQIIQLLIENGAQINQRDNMGLTPFHMAAELGYTDITKLFINTYDVDPNCTTMEGKWTALHLASGNKHAAVIRYLLEKGASVNERCLDNTTPLHWAVASGNVEIVKILVNNAAEIDAQEYQGLSALHLACQNGNEDIVKVLLKHNANTDLKNFLNITPWQLAIKNRHSSLIKYLLELSKSEVNDQIYGLKTKLHIASREGFINIVNQLVQMKALIDALDEEKLTPLHLASQNGHLNVIKLLLSKQANIDACDITGRTPLILAIAKCHEEVALFLISKNANVKLKTKDNITALHAAVMKGLLNLVSTLLKHTPDIEAKYANQTALIMALLRGYENIALLLLDYYADINVCTNDKFTPLHIAVEKNLPIVTAKLLDLCGNVNAKASNNVTPLYLAAENGNYDVVKKMLEKGANPNIKIKNNGATALSLAVQNGFKEVVSLLLRYSADINARDDRGLTALHIVSFNGRSDILEILLESNADLESVTQDGLTSLHFAAFNGHANIIKIILSKKTDFLNKCNEKVKPPIFLAVENKHKSAIDVLLSFNADINITVENGLTVLHKASEKGLIDIVELLFLKANQVQHIINFQTIDKGYTALHMACLSGFRDIAELLLKHNADATLKSTEGISALEIASQAGYRDIVGLFLPKEIGDGPDKFF